MSWGRRRSGAWTAAATLVVAAAMIGCASNGDGGDPLAGGPPSEDARLQPGDRPVRFRLDTAVSDAAKAFLIETLGWAHADLGDSGPLTVHVYSNEDHFVEAYVNDYAIDRQTARQELADGQFAFAGDGGHIWIYLPNFELDPPDERRVTLYHEYFHTVQSWLAELRFQSEDVDEQSFVPRWLVEGCAEYTATKAAAGRGFLDEQERRALIMQSAKDSNESLPSLESAGGASFIGGSGHAYTVGYVGCERLASTRGPQSVMRTFWAALARQRNWTRAFVEAFGLTPAEFYADFAAWWATTN